MLTNDVVNFEQPAPGFYSLHIDHVLIPVTEQAGLSQTWSMVYCKKAHIITYSSENTSFKSQKLKLYLLRIKSMLLCKYTCKQFH